jgi:hypothetical protein
MKFFLKLGSLGRLQGVAKALIKESSVSQTYEATSLKGIEREDVTR